MKKLDSIENLIKHDRYQVFLFACPAPLPISFAVHSWFVVNNKGQVSRWEVGFGAVKRGSSWGHLNLDEWPPFQGMTIFPFFLLRKFCWRSTSLKMIEGDECSVAAHMTEFITASPQTYPYCSDYSLIGYNSNTYVQWVINHFPESGMQLPWNSFGKSKAPNAVIL